MTTDDLFALNVRLRRALVARIDAYITTLEERTPGARYTRTDVVRIALEELMRDVAPAAPAKKAAGRR